jgi:cbb3-type cytochrome oxidase maturation protein
VEIVYLLLPLAVLIAAGIVAVFLWAVKSGQFDDLEGPAHRILMDDDEPPAEAGDKSSDKTHRSAD